MSLREKNLITAREFQVNQKLVVERPGIAKVDAKNVLAGDSDLTGFFINNRKNNLSTNTANYFKDVFLQPEVQIL